MTGKRLVLFLGAALMGAAVMPGDGLADEMAQLLDQKTQSQQENLLSAPSEPGVPPALPRTAETVDTRAVWFHLRRHDAAAAESELNRIRSDAPNWTPPEDLVQALAMENLRAALSRGETALARTIAASLKDFDHCERPDIAWLLLDTPTARKGLLEMAAKCPDGPIAASSMDRYLAGLPDDLRDSEIGRLRRLSWPLAVRQRLDARAAGPLLEELGDPSLSDERLDAIARHRDDIPGLRTALANAYFNRAMRTAGEGEGVESLTVDAAKAIEFGHTDVWLNLGWRLKESGNPQEAEKAFQLAGTSEVAIYGRALSLREAGRSDEASTLACGQRRQSSRLTAICLSSQSERQLAAFQRNDFDEALAIGERLLAIAPGNRGARTLSAWAASRSGQWPRAAQLFTTLYDQSPDDDLAQGLAESLRETGAQAEIDARIAAGDGRLRGIVDRQLAATAFGRKQFDLAASVSQTDDRLTGKTAWQTTSGIEASDTSGVKGMGRLTIVAARQSAEGMVGNVRIGVTALGYSVTGGRPVGATDMGTYPGSVYASAASSITRSSPLSGAGAWQPVLTGRRESPDLTVSGRLSTTPPGSPFSLRPTGNLAVTDHLDPVILSGRLFSEDIASSLLSYNGLRDRLTGRYWGRVIDSGGGLQSVFLPADRVSLSVSAEAAHLDGENVANNDRVGLRADAGYDFRPEGFDHLRSGPFISWTHFNRNLSHYTIGQGGYYSPASDRRLGLSVDALTAEGQSWQVEAKSSLAYGQAREAVSPRFPLTPDDRQYCGPTAQSLPGGTPLPVSVSCVYGASKTSGLDTDLTLRASVLVSEQLILSGFTRYSQAPGYTNIALGTYITIPFDGRRALFSSDLPDSLFNPFR